MAQSGWKFKTFANRKPGVLPLLWLFLLSLDFPISSCSKGCHPMGKWQKEKKYRHCYSVRPAIVAREEKFFMGIPYIWEAEAKIHQEKIQCRQLCRQTMPFIHVGSCIYPVFSTHRWHDSIKKKSKEESLGMARESKNSGWRCNFFFKRFVLLWSENLHSRDEKSSKCWGNTGTLAGMAA